MDSSNLLIFIICAFALGIILILSRNNIPPKLRRSFAITALVMVVIAFGLLVYSFFSMGQ
ncbi:hypothetical protein DFP94_102497 [Fontibacillus phaseoli]|uniref:Signal transduction histidine kinase n=1 Tax=Fontibacillus phaseoli TaxID=1416533 RepID=A0A369BJG4_9BACL|nr:hypothetical protein [Fontibacillus phaseoli]RCX21740.1 hypothetical protein DFP94_102497 [Fontibacillus phaseoli]